jgi:ubiquitin carboxyl-terminal hydrolase 14
VIGPDRVKAGQPLTMLGSSEGIPEKPSEKIVFTEDLSVAEQAEAGPLPSGVENLGNTCYLNSVAHFLRAMQEVRDFSEAMEPVPAANPTSQRFINELRGFFRSLRKTGAPVTPLSFVSQFRATFAQFAQQSEQGGWQQQDAQECFSTLVTAVKGWARGGGELVQGLLECDCTAELRNVEDPTEVVTMPLEKFELFPCSIDNTVNHLHEGLTLSLGGKVTKMSAKLGRNAEFTKAMRIQRLPKYFPIHFQRFLWKPKEKTKAKILRTVKFPFVLDAYHLCTEELKKTFTDTRAKLHAVEDRLLSAQLKGEPLTAEQQAENAVALAELATAESGLYELISVVTHAGRQADGGHYIAFVKVEDKQNEWLRYDDDTVSVVKDQEIEALSGGGDWHAAYLALYRRKVPTPSPAALGTLDKGKK